MKYGYKETRKISMEALRSLCIRNNWYTSGTCEEYDNLLTTSAGYDTITCDELVEIATDIKSHSDIDYEIESVMYAVAEVCNSYFEEC